MPGVCGGTLGDPLLCAPTFLRTRRRPTCCRTPLPAVGETNPPKEDSLVGILYLRNFGMLRDHRAETRTQVRIERRPFRRNDPRSSTRASGRSRWAGGRRFSRIMASMASSDDLGDRGGDDAGDGGGSNVERVDTDDVAGDG